MREPHVNQDAAAVGYAKLLGKQAQQAQDALVGVLARLHR